ncbi:MAG: heme lyase CcmF/NrfE family subunit [bacterium]|nr:heme lyase CcmF/NrfE family subunit [bacterium]
MANIGYASLAIAFLCVISLLVVSVLNLRSPKKLHGGAARNLFYAIAGLLTFAMLVLLGLLIQQDFQTTYVASYTNRALPTTFIVSALWAGQEGSLLFWAWALALCSLVFFIQYHKKAGDELPYVNIALALTLGFFILLLLVTANPFEQLDFTPQDGNGMNPLLQNLYMAMHPPILFIGYAGFVVPFALAFAALCCGKIDERLVAYVRGWTLFSWYFLGMGILLGAHWAYLELGWGGYWGWDPVENASLIPWLTGTALIHTLILQRKQGMLKIWNLILSIMTFSLCLLATLITRSGVIDSVHAFGKSSIGYYFLSFLALILLCAIGLIVLRWKTLKEIYDLQSLLSKEGHILLTNHLFMGVSVAVLYGTLYPFFSELFTQKKVVVDAVFFNRVAIPVGLSLLALLGLCQMIAWRKASWDNLRKRFLLSFQITLVGLVLLSVLSGMQSIPTLLTCGFGLFVLSTMGVNFGKSVMLRRKNSPQAFGKTAVDIILSQRERYAGYLFHIGVVLMCVGMAVSASYKLEKEITMTPGESVALGDLNFKYDSLKMQKDEQKSTVVADVLIYKNNKQIASVMPQKRFHGKAPDWQVTTEIGLRTTLLSDIYVILQNWDDDQNALFTFIVNPFIIWIWIGGFLLFTLGILFEMLPETKKKETPVNSQKRSSQKARSE